MSSKAVAFFTGLGAGLLDGQEALDKKARQKKLDAQADAEFEARQKDRALIEKERKAVAEAGAPLEVNTNAATLDASGKPVLYEDAGVANSDLRQARTMGQQDVKMAPAIAAGGVQYQDLPSAQKAVAEGNTPDGTALRQATALAGINPERGARMRADVRQGQAADLSLQTAKAEQARKMKEEGLFDALRAFRQGDAKGMVDAFNKGGQFKIDGQVTMEPEDREIPGYGKITTYNATFNAVGPDGKAMPVKINSHDYSMQALPYEKALTVRREGVKTEAEANKDNATAEYYRGAKTAAAAGKPVAEKPYKMDEDDKLRFQEANKSVHEAEKALNDAMGKLMPGDDPAKSPAVAHAQGLVRNAKLNQLKTHIAVGVITPEQYASDILAVAKNEADVFQSLKEAATLAGTDFGDKVAAFIQGSDVWAGMANKPKPTAPKTPQGRAIAAAPAGSVVLQDGKYVAPGSQPSAPVAAGGIAKPAAVAPAVGDKPVRGPNEPINEYRARLVQWDNARMAAEQAATEVAADAQRRAMVQARPDLQKLTQGARF